ncbi:DUF1810 domain-containing protein [Xylophilus sp. GOD-11R]|uniref:DUF1810 domain-containing protein n=1 Tax=Xylophilus sp. GOD-11R TaxID=3089814 RepID=UPI00298C1274|nr:DUF1810 domain-containing protein [Xylophilus sp. GOD-11R]WPB58111.1 DUF1810 domain-containing protein [Xylophilus sp. GOD-11R]
MNDGPIETHAERDPWRLTRFVEAQNAVLPQVHRELASGHKRGHWMWFVFPQLRALGRSEMSQHFGLANRAEARAYQRHPTLGPRLLACCELLMRGSGHDAREVFGAVDAMKLRSCMTLFAAAAPEHRVFNEVLEKFFPEGPDTATRDLLGDEW